MDKTIKQIADDLGVSKTAVRKKIDNLGLRSSLRKNGNQFVIDETQEKAIISAFRQKDKTETSSQTETETVSTLISMLQNELEIKNKQIKELNERLAENQKLLDQEQQLHAMTKQELKRLEAKEEAPEAPEPEEPEPQKKSWLNFFRKGNT